MEVVCHLGLGSNLGNRAENLHRACTLLDRTAGLQVRRASAVYETEPVGVTEQPMFLNQVVEILTRLSPSDLMARLLEVEEKMGRVRRERWGPRVIDIDLLLCGRRIIERSGLNVPHPRMKERAFVMVPLAELAPGLVLPDGGRVDEIARRLAADGQVVVPVAFTIS